MYPTSGALKFGLVGGGTDPGAFPMGHVDSAGEPSLSWYGVRAGTGVSLNARPHPSGSSFGGAAELWTGRPGNPMGVAPCGGCTAKK